MGHRGPQRETRVFLVGHTERPHAAVGRKFRVRLRRDDLPVAPMVGAERREAMLTMLMTILLMVLGGATMLVAFAACLVPGGMGLALLLLMGGGGLWAAAAVVGD
jgi:hypothetical protein